MANLPKIPGRACKGCGKLIYFCKDDNGTVHCLDAQPPIFVQIRGDGVEPMVMKVTGFVSHFATCPQANKFSSSRQGANHESH